MRGFCILAVLLWLCGCSQPSSPETTPDSSPVAASPAASVTPEADSAKAAAQAAFQEFGGRLKKELMSAIESGGPVQAVEVCHSRAPLIATEVSDTLGLEMGRSSHKTRNPDNAPSPAVAAFLEKYSEQKAADVPVEVVEEGDHQLVIAPIPTAPLCLTCHGDPATFSPELKGALEKFYPQDQATGFEVGDMRGVFWAKVAN